VFLFIYRFKNYLFIIILNFIFKLGFLNFFNSLFYLSYLFENFLFLRLMSNSSKLEELDEIDFKKES
jgi:hypothetical protein